MATSVDELATKAMAFHSIRKPPLKSRTRPCLSESNSGTA
jgi:hypothetical protein